jgi:putative hydrolase of the HAD superfamily
MARHFAALTTNVQAAREFGITTTFGFWDWVGGRYSLWSAIGLPIAIAIGASASASLLAGAHAMDEHFAAGAARSQPAGVLGLLDVWYRNFHGFGQPQHRALPPGPARGCRPTCSSWRWKATASASIWPTATPLPFATSPGAVGRARHQRPACVLPDAAPGHRRGAGGVHRGHGLDGDWSAFDRGAIEPDALVTRLAARSGLPHDGVAALLAAIPGHLQPMPASVALLERLRAARHRIGLLSNMPRPFADHLEATHACFGWFEQRAWSGHLGLMKPERAVFEHVQRSLGIADASALVFIDDHPANVDAARRCGWQALLFTSAEQCAEELAAAGWL